MQDYLERQNPHWKGNLASVDPIKRSLYDVISTKYLDDDLIQLVNGPRRTGKSIILRQLINYLIGEKSIDSTQILFFEFSPGQDAKFLEELFYTFKHEILPVDKKAYIFFDEIQYVAGYEAVIKLIFDLYKGHVKIFLTGSLSVSYKKRMQESLAGRFIEHKLYPLSFEEYLKLRQHTEYANYVQLKSSNNNLLKSGFAERMRSEFEEFLRYKRLPETISYSDVEKAALYNKTVINQSLNQDALSYFSVGYPQTLSALFQYISENNGAELSIKNLSENVFSVGMPTLSSYLDILEIMGLIYIVKNTVNPLKVLNSARKVYISSHYSSLNLSVGYLVESFVLEMLIAQRNTVTYYRNRDKEIDFLMPQQKKAIEVKYRSQISPDSTKNLIVFCKKESYFPIVFSLADSKEENGMFFTPSLFV